MALPEGLFCLLGYIISGCLPAYLSARVASTAFIQHATPVSSSTVPAAPELKPDTFIFVSPRHELVPASSFQLRVCKGYSKKSANSWPRDNSMSTRSGNLWEEKRKRWILRGWMEYGIFARL